MSTMNAVASAFWPHIEDQEIADLAFSHVNHFGRRVPQASPSAAVTGRYYKGSLTHVNSIAANPHVDAAVLRRFAKDTRVSVRQALLTNPSTPLDVIADLLVWAIGRHDRLPEQALARLSLAAIATTLSRAAETERAELLRRCDADFEAIAERCTTEPDQALALARAGVQGLTVALARVAHQRRLGSVSLTSLTETDPESCEAVLSALFNVRESLTVELASLWKAWRDNPDNRTYRHFGFSTEAYASVEAGAANVLVAGDLAQLTVALINGADDDLLTERAVEASLDELTAMVDAIKYRPVSARCEAAIATRLTWLRQASSPRLSVQRALESFRHPLPVEVLLNLLRTGSPETTVKWLHDIEHPCSPRKGMLAALYANPGRALGSQPGDDTTSEHSPLRSTAISAAAERLELADEVIEHYDRWIGEHLHVAAIAAVVYPTLKQTLSGPQSRAAWETFLALAADWSDSFTQLVTTVVELNGIDMPVTVDPSTEGNLPARNLQLTLL